MIICQIIINHIPTFNFGTNRDIFKLRFLLSMEDDSVDGIFNTLKGVPKISKYAGGIGLSVHNIRAKNSFIAGTNGVSNGIIPMLRVFNDTARYIDQGGGENGSLLFTWNLGILIYMNLLN